MCSKKLKAAIPLWLPFYESVYKALTPEIQERLLSVSAATIDRLLKPVRVVHGRKGLSGTRPGMSRITLKAPPMFALMAPLETRFLGFRRGDYFSFFGSISSLPFCGFFNGRGFR
jgi:hypothetical protein